MWYKTGLAILAVMLIALVSISQTVKADAPVIVGVYSGLNEQPPFDVGQSFTIAFEVTQPFSGTATATVKIDKSQCVTNDPTCHIWTYGSPISVESGKMYNVHPPAISTPGSYKASVLVIFPPPGGAIAGYAYFQVEGSSATPATDWAVLSVSLSPSAPQVGDPVTFKMVMAALSSPAPFPQSFSAQCVIDGASCGGGSLTYPGPAGTPFTVSAQTPWIATLGKHTLAWGVATIPVGLDPNKSNNMKTTTFTVAQGSSQQTTTTSSTAFQVSDFQIDVGPASQSVLQGETVSYTVNVAALNGFNSQVSLMVSGLPSGANGVFSNPSGTPNFASTLTVILPGDASTGSYTLIVTGSGGGLSHVANLVLIVNAAVVTQTSTSSTQTTSTQTSGPPVGDLLGLLQQNGLLILATVVIIALLAVAASRRRRPSVPARAPQGQPDLNPDSSAFL